MSNRIENGFSGREPYGHLVEYQNWGPYLDHLGIPRLPIRLVQLCSPRPGDTQCSALDPQSVHHPDHWIRVGIFSLLLAYGLQLHRDPHLDMVTLCLDAREHDFMGSRDAEEPLHGYNISVLIPHRMPYLPSATKEQICFATAYHAAPNEQIPQWTLALLMLMEGDLLDRGRSLELDGEGDLDPRYIRTRLTHDLVPLAKDFTRATRYHPLNCKDPLRAILDVGIKMGIIENKDRDWQQLGLAQHPLLPLVFEREGYHPLALPIGGANGNGY